MAKVPQMSTDFARWYAEAFMDEGSKRDLRWNGVVALASKADEAVIEVLTRLAFRTATPASGRKSEDLGKTYATVISTISGGDAAFDATRDARELQVLAAAALVRMFATVSDAALVVTTAALAGARKPDLPMDLVGLAEAALVSLSARKHVRQPFDEIELAAPKLTFTADLNVLSTMQPAQFKTQFDQLHAATAAAIERVVTGQNRVVRELHRRIQLGEEELQMLWWLTGGYSRAADSFFDKVPEPIRPLVLARELGEMTAVSPGPGSIRAMLSRAGVGTSTVKLADAVNGVDGEWAKSASEPRLVSPATTPIHFALEQRLETGSTESWQAGWAGLTGVSADVELPAAKLAELFYREHVFLNVGS